MCSAFGDQAKSFASKIEEISKNDSASINKVRALEFLGMVLNRNTVNDMALILNTITSIGESMLILKSWF